MTAVTRELRAVLRDAREIARELASPQLEAEHLLLAVARRGGGAADVLAAAGLDYEGLVDALEAERTASLAAVGVRLVDFDLPAPRRAASVPRWGASAALAVRRASAAAGRGRARRMTPAHLLLGVLRAQAGTVPRALGCAGVDPAVLAATVESRL